MSKKIIAAFIAGLVIIVGVVVLATSSEEDNTQTVVDSETVGVYTANIPAASSPSRSITLDLQENGNAQMTTDYQNDEEPVTQTGEWRMRDDNRMAVSFEGGEEIVFEKRGNMLMAVEYDEDSYGTAGLELTQSVPESDENETYTFSCSSGDDIQISYSGDENSQATVALPNNEYDLSRVRSASGARYANTDESVVYWESGGKARVEMDGEVVYENCAREDANPDNIASEDSNTSEVLKFEVAPERQTCDAGAGQRECLVVNDELFYDEIDGFEFEAGNQYTLRVRRTKRENVPADASRFNYELVEVVSEMPAEESATSSAVVSQRAGLLGTSWQWQLTEYPGWEDIVADNPSEFVLTFNEDSRFGASTDCNQIGGSYDIDIGASEVSLSQMMSTKVACPEGAQEEVFSGMLAQVEGYEVTQTNELHLMLESGGMMRFRRN